MTREELNKLIMQACERTWNEKTCKEIEQALSQEPCTDNVSEKEQKPCKYCDEDGFCLTQNLCISQRTICNKYYAAQEPCDNAISRSGAIKAIEERAKRIKNEDTLNGLAGAVGILFELPPVTQKPIECDDAVSREAVDKYIVELLSGYLYAEERERLEKLCNYLWELPPVNPQETVTEFADRCRVCGARYGKLLKQKSGKCKNCKYFEYDSVAKVDGIPLIVAHEICSRWGEGCKTREDGYCFLYEPQESEDKE